VEKVKAKIKVYHDFPRQGIKFQDLNPVYADIGAYRRLIKEALFETRYEDFDYVAGIESRGFIIGSTLAHELGVGFFPIRKKGKLPGHQVFRGEPFNLEYGSDQLEVQAMDEFRGKSVLIVDDVFATGGTMQAAVHLLHMIGVTHIGALVAVDIGIADRNILGVKSYVLIK
jgi:adenine phosphoribosyltransferase